MSEVADPAKAAEETLEEKIPAKTKRLKMLPVESSNIQEIGYSAGPAGKPGNLYVKSVTGNTYAYEDVSADVWQEFLESPSKGQHFAAHIRKVYRFHKVKEKMG